jgi:raffinose/stachyose/melibiose transport system permease protein
MPARGWRLRLWIAALLAPGLAVLAVFVVMPLASAFLYSLYSWNGLARGEFAGLANFHTVLFQPPFSTWTYNAFLNNCIAFASLMVVQNGTAFLIAFALFKTLPGHRFHQVAVFLPVVLSTVIIGLVNAWHWVGFPALVFLAGMQRIPPDAIEAAKLDGAGDWVLIRHIVWPLVAPATTVVVILTFIGSFNWFEMPYVMTGLDGSPAGATDVLGLYFYRTAFGNVTSGLQDFGRGSALAVLMFLFIGVVATIWTRILRRREMETG